MGARSALDYGRPDATSDSEKASEYAGVIGRLAPGEDASRVEAAMRIEHGTLERLDAIHFAREVKAAVARIHASSS